MIVVLGSVLFDGIAFGGLLFVVSLGMAITMGLMNFVNLAHGAFAMFGGYACFVLASQAGWPFLATLPVVFVGTALVGALLERLLYRHLYQADHLDQVLFTVGLTFVAIACATFIFGSSQKSIPLPEWLQGNLEVAGMQLGRYRVFVLGFVVALTVLLLALMKGTRFGAQVRASVDNATAARGVGIHVDRVFSVTFALGSGIAGLGGALGTEMLALEPNYALKYLVYFLIVSTIGGAGSVVGALVVALVLGVADVLGSYFVPQVGAFVIYTVMIVLLVVFPAGLFGRRA